MPTRPPLPLPRPRSRPALALAAVSVLAFAAGCTSDGKIDTGLEKEEDEGARQAHYEEAAQTFYDGGKYRAAEEQWRKVLASEPESPKANWGLAMSLARQGDAGSLRASEQIFQKIVQWNWQHPTLGDRRHEVLKDFAEVYLELADLYDADVRLLEERRREQGDTAALAVDPDLGRKIQTQVAARNALLRKATPLFEQVLAQSPDNPYALAGLAKAHLLVGDHLAGLGYARRYVDLSRRSQEGWQEKLDQIEKENQVLTADQREWFKGKIRGATEKELRMHLLMATVLMRREDYAGAIVEYDRILEIDPARPVAYVERAQARAGAKDYRAAVKDVQEYLKITDPIRHRGGRIAAADLLDRYRALADARTAPPPPRGLPVRAASTPVSAPAVGPGSPDG
jgi:tetratricopeptide (TPR) repeat protein